MNNGYVTYIAVTPLYLLFDYFCPELCLTVSYQEHQKDASYITVSSRPTTDSEPGARIVKSMSLRAAITKGQVVRLGESNKSGGPVKPSVFEVNKFFRRLTFTHQVRKKDTIGQIKKNNSFT